MALQNAFENLATESKQDTIIREVSKGYTRIIDEVSETVSYIGEATPGSSAGSSVWRIKKIDTSGDTTITWADGTNAFTKEWDERATYTYS